MAHSRQSNALVNHNGQVDLWSKPTLVKSTCKVDVKYFPFDEQLCSMKFGSWTYTSFQMNLDKHTDKPDLSTFVVNEQWDLKFVVAHRNIEKYECCPERYHDVTFYIGLKRKPLYYIYNLIMPCILLSSLSMLGFFMPYDVGVVKVSLSITLILSLTVFLLLVAEMMPRTSDEVPLIGIKNDLKVCIDGWDSVSWQCDPKRGSSNPGINDDPKTNQLSADLTNNEMRLTQLWVIFRVKLNDLRVIVDPDLDPMDPFRVKFDPLCF